jgi:Fur family peroxide stress response transcriptional regulator
MPRPELADTREARLQILTRRLKEHGHRLTPQRLVLLRALVESEVHPSADYLFARVRETCPTTSRATIYKTLETLKELGEVLELEFRDGSNRYDGVRPGSHPHFVCTRCGRIEDLDVLELNNLLEHLAKSAGPEIHSFRCDFFGVCDDCG